MSAPEPGLFAVAAGGTGGHMVPADALAGELRRRGHGVLLLSDPRGLSFAGLFEGVDKLTIPCASPDRGGPASWPSTALQLFAGWRRSRSLFRKRLPSAVIGFGGYPALPALLAATTMRLPTIIHEQNAVLGRTNRLLARRVDRIATGYAHVEKLSGAAAERAVVVGNPVRGDIVAVGKAGYTPPGDGERLRLLVIGGSQGARILSRAVPEAICGLHRDGAALEVVQQCRPEDLDRVSHLYANAGVDAELAPFFTDMPARLARAHLVISRAGASSLAELTASARPSILIPFAAAADDHQSANARGLARAGGAEVIAEAALASDSLARMIGELLADPARLAAMSAAAASVARPDAGRQLADLVEQTARPLAASTQRTPARLGAAA